MIILISIIIAAILRSRYISDNDPWILRIAYYCSCMVWTPILGIPFYKLITATISDGPYSRIYRKDGSRA